MLKSGRASTTTRGRLADRAMATVASLESPSATTHSKSRSVWASRLAISRGNRVALFRVAVITEIAGIAAVIGDLPSCARYRQGRAAAGFRA